MTDPLLVRPAEAADRPQWEVLWHGYNAFYGRAGATAFPEAVTASARRRFLEEDEPVEAMVAQQGRVLVGPAHCVWHQSTTSMAPSCYLQDLFTLETARGTGVGRALIDAACVRARAAGASRLYRQTHESNGTARRLYDGVASHDAFVVYTLPSE